MTHYTKIGTHPPETDRLLFRGKDTLRDLVGTVTFTQSIYLGVTGRLPTELQTRILDACLVILVDHGITPSVLVARIVADSVPADIQVSIAAGLLTVGSKFVGTMQGAGEIFAQGIASGQAPDEFAAQIVAKNIAAKKRLPGYGHPDYSTADPRTARLFAVAEQAGVAGNHIAIARAIATEIKRQSGKNLVLNATGAIAALLGEIDFPTVAMRGVAVVSRSAGLLAHALEELERPTSAHTVALAQTAVPYSDDF
jgi:citrate synthase